MTDLKPMLGLSAGALSFLAFCLYIYTTLRGDTKPNRATWWVLTLVGVMISASYYGEGARHTIWVSVSYIVGPFIVAVLSVRYGEGEWEQLDKWCVAAAITSAVVWYAFKSPLVALQMNIAMDFVALIPTIKKSYFRPDGEDRIAWALESFSGVINIIALERWTIGLAFYPLYLLVMNSLVTLLLFRRPGRE